MSWSRPAVRYQRRILAWGGALACLLYVVGAPIYVRSVESDLTERVTAELTAAGFDGVGVSFSGQTGSITCARPLGDPRAAFDLASGVRGVRVINDLPDACRVRVPDERPDTTSTTHSVTEPGGATTTSSLTADFRTVSSLLAGNPRFSMLDQLVRDSGLGDLLSGDEPVTLFAPTNAAFDALPADAVARLRSDPELIGRVIGHHLVSGRLLLADLETGPLATAAGDDLEIDADGDVPLIQGVAVVDADALAANGVVHAVDQLLVPDGVDLDALELRGPVTATLDDGQYVLAGVVRSEVERTILVVAAAAAVGAPNVIDEITVDPDRGVGEPTAQDVAALIPAVAAALLAGSVSFDGEAIVVSGTFDDEGATVDLAVAAAAVGAELTLAEQPRATDDDARALETELNEFVLDNPISFEPTSSVLDPSAGTVLDEVARRARRYPGVVITVEGHTDSDGSAQQNLVLSQARAVVVQQALLDRGVVSVLAEGFGSARPIVVDGVEDKAASRRVEFRVVTE